MMKQQTGIETVDSIFGKWYLSLLRTHADSVLDGKCSVGLASKRISIQTGENYYDIERDLIEIVCEMGKYKQVDFV